MIAATGTRLSQWVKLRGIVKMTPQRLRKHLQSDEEKNTAPL